MAQSKALDGKIEESEAIRDKLEKDLARELNKIGNILHPDVPVSKSEDDNKVVRTFGVPSDLVVTGEELGKLHHHEVMQCLDIVELERGSRVAGHRGYYLKGLGVLLNQALINFGIKMLMQKGYTPTQPPFFVKKSVMEATCQLSDFSENLY